MKNAVVVLAAGKGTRMKSQMSKILHKVAGKPMVSHVISAGEGIRPERTVVVYSADAVAEFIRDKHHTAHLAIQTEQLGTGHAVKAAKEALEDINGNIMVLTGDCPLITAELIERFLESHVFQNNDITFLSIIAEDPTGLGRVVRNEDDDVTAIVEEKDATSEQKEIDEVNAGFFVAKADVLWEMLEKLSNDNAQAEYYLTDIVKLGAEANFSVGTFTAEDADALSGVNSRLQLAMAEDYFQNRKREDMMASGVTMTDPQSVFFSADTAIGNDVEIGPNVQFGPNVRIESGVILEGNLVISNTHLNEDVKILSFCHLDGLEAYRGAKIGPFARVRSGAEVGQNAKIGSFVELKKSKIGNKSSVAHLSYIGDAFIGSDVNIGAGTVTSNYDGKNKHQTTIEDNVHTGANCTIVAPVTIKKGATTAANSIIIEDVPADTLIISKVTRFEDPSFIRPRKDK
jgi:bifunctional UDP-N-acetylglucosamine pyrophosphorylase/glucosamine-1-phosphate N-acetyltransferase